MKLLLLTALATTCGSMMFWLFADCEPEAVASLSLPSGQREAGTALTPIVQPEAPKRSPSSPEFDSLDTIEIRPPALVSEASPLVEIVGTLEHPNGAWKLLHSNGEIDELGAYQNDLEVGRWKWWYENGRRKAIGSFDRGQRTGTWTWYHDNGSVMMEGQYLGGHGVGLWKNYYPSGLPRSEGNFIEGQIAGQWTFWNEDGSVDETLTGRYEKGQLQ